ncbi:MAG: hypothetical protein V4649_04980 [Bacteroidota bacterium]
MKVLALTHAHLDTEGLSPVSCERADSIAGTWAGKLGWEVDVVHTAGTRWRGIWPNGEGLKINILNIQAPHSYMLGTRPLFTAELKAYLEKRKLAGLASLVGSRIASRARHTLAVSNLALPADLAAAGKWGRYIARQPELAGKKYDFIFVCVGYGDEYLLQTAHVLSRLLHIPTITDLRDLWSEHHEPARFTDKQRKQVRRHEVKLLANTALISVPQKHMKHLLDKWVNKPVYMLSHSAYADKVWHEGRVTHNEFIMLYAGKLYAGGPGIKMLLELVKQLAQAQQARPFRCRFFVDDVKKLQELAADYDITKYVEANAWIAPGELWTQMRSAHLLVIPDPGVAEHYPVLPTKTFQYAYTGRQILGLLEFANPIMQEFLQEHNAGMATTKVSDAVPWVSAMMSDETLYKELPPLRRMPFREELAEAYGREIQGIIAGK